MSCLVCALGNGVEFSAEMIVHLSGLRNIDYCGVFVFPKVLVCLDCGCARFKISETELAFVQTLAHFRLLVRTAPSGGSYRISGFATHLVGAREVTRVRGVQKTPEAARMALAMGRKSRNGVQAARPPGGSGGGLKWQTWQTFAIPKSRLSCLESGGREGIRTPGLLVANEECTVSRY